MKFLVRCDMEGVTSVVSYAQVEPGRVEYAEAREAFMQEMLALIDGLQIGGATEIVIYDEHWFGRNLQLDRLPKGVSAICGKPPYRADWAGGLDESFAGVILHGLHSKAGSGKLLNHSYEHDIAGIEINGHSVGEIGVEAAIAGDFNVPVFLVIADSGGAEEARGLLQNVATVETKTSQSPDGACCLPLVETTQVIREAATTIATRPPAVAPLHYACPVQLSIQFHEGAFCEAVRRRAGHEMDSPSCLTFRDGESVTALWAKYWVLKLQCLADMEDNKNTKQ